MPKINLEQFAADKGARYFLISFTDLFGVARAKLVPADAIAGMQKEGAGFAGFAAHLDMTPADPDMLAFPDPDSVIQLPWNPEIAWVAADLHMNGEPVAHAPRNVLKSVLTRAGKRVESGVECEFFVLNADGDAHADALTTADRHAFFKFMVRSAAEKRGLRATFMPKPVRNLTGNGCHCHMSVWDGERNVFEDSGGELGLSPSAYCFIGGLLENAAGMSAIANPVVNSYKRINAPRTSSGATWSPNTATYGGNNRTHMIRIPAGDRVEVRLADGAANPYLLQSALIAAGFEGMARETAPGKRLDLDMYAEGDKVKKAPRLPLNLLDALRQLEKNTAMRKWLGGEFVSAYVKLKTEEWNSYMRHFTEWERENAMDL